MRTQARPGGSAYSLTKFGIVAFAESLRQELIMKRVRVGVIEPGTVDTELVTHLREDVRQAARSQVDSIESRRPTPLRLRRGVVPTLLLAGTLGALLALADAPLPQ
jgi:NAD(P)-dependent dehydrogenase (short-subunit alcohol dehydrogenase family)